MFGRRLLTLVPIAETNEGPHSAGRGHAIGLLRLLLVTSGSELLFFIVYAAEGGAPSTSTTVLLLVGVLAMLAAVLCLENLERKGISYSIADAWRPR